MKKLVKLNPIVSMYQKPVLGRVKAENRFMALSVNEQTRNPFKGIAKEIIKSKGSVDKPDLIGKSKLMIIVNI